MRKQFQESCASVKEAFLFFVKGRSGENGTGLVTTILGNAGRLPRQRPSVAKESRVVLGALVGEIGSVRTHNVLLFHLLTPPVRFPPPQFSIQSDPPFPSTPQPLRLGFCLGLFPQCFHANSTEP